MVEKGTIRFADLLQIQINNSESSINKNQEKKDLEYFLKDIIKGQLKFSHRKREKLKEGVKQITKMTT